MSPGRGAFRGLPARQAILLGLVLLAGAAFRLYGLGWGAPYHHFHIDEHFVFVGAVELKKDFLAAAQSPKFFMYSPLPMYLAAGLSWLHEWVSHPLDLTLKADGIRFMLLGRSISAVFGTATVLLVYLVGFRAAGRTAGLIAAALTAAGVLHLRESHFFTVDVTLTFFSVLAWLYCLRLAETGAPRDYALAGVAIGLALLCKYSAAFLVPLAGLAHLLAPGRPAWRPEWRAWLRWAGKGAVPGLVGLAVFLLLDPLVVLEFDKFVADIRQWVTNPLTGAWRPIWTAQFTNVEPWSFWFTNILFWGLGPAFEVWALLGILWLLRRRDPAALVLAAFPIVYYLVAGRTITPFARYGVPLVPALAVTAAVLSADLLARPRWRRVAVLATAVVLATTVLYAIAYMNVYRAPDARLAASRYLLRHVPADARLLVEPSHNIPPTGLYLAAPNFHRDYVLWQRDAHRHDYYHLFALDTYRYLYNPRVSPEEKQAYIARRLARVDYIVMDDTFLQFYHHLPASEHGVVKQYYADLFSGRLGFTLMETFKTYPALGGLTINDDAAELSFRLFDHPRVFIFRRQ